MDDGVKRLFGFLWTPKEEECKQYKLALRRETINAILTPRFIRDFLMNIKVKESSFTRDATTVSFYHGITNIEKLDVLFLHGYFV